MAQGTMALPEKHRNTENILEMDGNGTRQMGEHATGLKNLIPTSCCYAMLHPK